MFSFTHDFRFQEIERMLIQRCSRSSLSINEHDIDPEYVDETFEFLPKVRLATVCVYLYALT